ncbi:23S rRNA (adenine(2030)-N(6))-methyltransferase RlmJ [Pseudooceanicola sediminis]|uniref:Ribosomal RNA large subunit methyltransferase J n=1 Tax=Pseudooceanicola sediminis TaxID=2211117 RepID=A0A399IY30_9RHOB|nr:23S rRNA (adenine(2030)-N(6))-methyltransferase RlmJ [Pseudooceanicola sediminis]RII37931.1 23S rRNA (adenine(2030)-N(6))-methyltransferase RlmJ [Pseudooceanicola sediminis]|tara:strand:+ start:42731 stop:43510 length:780 start_codon:yes stop_codon:yes gene_type:complete
MLSYQHIYHAGNPADLHKHALLAVMLARMTEKAKPISYLETHAGRGLYDLGSAEALKTGEAAAGIGARGDWFAPDHPLARAVAAVRAEHGPDAYPGSPRVAAELLRQDDLMHLAELHPREHDALLEAMIRHAARVYRQDGFEMAMSLCPPEPKRGMIVIDPSYEMKEDYATIPDFIRKLHRKWNVGVIALWYPILRDARHHEMIAELEEADLPKVLKSEVAFPPVRKGHGMIGSGMFIVNTPFGAEVEAARLAALFAQG